MRYDTCMSLGAGGLSEVLISGRLSDEVLANKAV